MLGVETCQYPTSGSINGGGQEDQEQVKPGPVLRERSRGTYIQCT